MHELSFPGASTEPTAAETKNGYRLLRIRFSRGPYGAQPFGTQRSPRRRIFLRLTLARGVGESPATPHYVVH